MKRVGISKAGKGEKKKIRTEIKKRNNQLHLKQSKRDGFCSKMTRLPLRITRIFCQAGYPSESYWLPWSCKNQSTKNRARILTSRAPCINKTQNRNTFLRLHTPSTKLKILTVHQYAVHRPLSYAKITWRTLAFIKNTHFQFHTSNNDQNWFHLRFRSISLNYQRMLSPLATKILACAAYPKNKAVKTELIAIVIWYSCSVPFDK